MLKRIILFLIIPAILSAAHRLPTGTRGANDYEYLIITTEALKNFWGDFIEFNKRRCLRTQVQTVEYIKSNVAGRDDAEKVRAYIKQQYEQCNIVFVLLGGDGDGNVVDNVPHRGFRACVCEYGKDYYEDKDIAADMYYSCLDGTWQVQGSQYFGEPGSEDIQHEVYAARFPVDNQTELSNLMNKTIKYSEQPVVDGIKNVLLAEETVWIPGQPPPPPIFFLDELIGVCNKNGYTTVGFPYGTQYITKMYDWSTSWTKANLLNTIREKKVAWIDNIGHGNPTVAMKLYTSDVTKTNFTNDGTNANFFLIYTQTCYAGSWDNRNTTNGSYTSSDCIGEQFTAGISNCAVAFIGSSRYIFGDEVDPYGTNGADQRFHRYFHDAAFNKKIHHLGMMLAYSKEVNDSLIREPDFRKPPYYGTMRWAAYGLNILGDPALSVWTEPPQCFPGNIIDIGNFSLGKFYWDSKLPYTWIALCKENGDFVTTCLTGPDGKCVIDDAAYKAFIDTLNPFKILVRIKAHNYERWAKIVEPIGGILNKNSDGLYQLKAQSNNKFIIITYQLCKGSTTEILLYNSKGTLAKKILQAAQSPGKYTITFKTDDLSNGIYYLQIVVNPTFLTLCRLNFD